MRHKPYTHTIAKPAESFKPYFYTFGFTVPRPLYARHQDGTLQVGKNGEVVYAPLETDWGLQATRTAYKKVFKFFWDNNLKIILTTKARQPGLKQYGNNIVAWQGGKGRFHVHGIVESDYKLSRPEIYSLKESMMKKTTTDTRDSVYFKEASEGCLKYALYITENALKTVRPVNEKHIRLINKSQDKSFEELFPLKEYLQARAGKGFALTTLCRLDFITKSTHNTPGKQRGLIAKIIRYIQTQAQSLNLPPPFPAAPA